MIHADNEKIEIKGSKIELKSELVFIIRAFIQNEVIKDDDDMIIIYKLATMTDEEVHKEVCRILDSMDIGEGLLAIMTARRIAEHE